MNDCSFRIFSTPNNQCQDFFPNEFFYFPDPGEEEGANDILHTMQHKYYCGIDLHTKKMYICILDSTGQSFCTETLKPIIVFPGSPAGCQLYTFWDNVRASGKKQ